MRLLLVVLCFASLGLLEAVHAQEKDSPPIPITQPKANYPFEMRRQGISGSVVVEITIDHDGNVAKARIVKQTNEAFGVSALQSVRRWKYRPAVRNGVPVNVRMKVPIYFDLGPAPEKQKP